MQSSSTLFPCRDCVVTHFVKAENTAFLSLLESCLTQSDLRRVRNQLLLHAAEVWGFL